jgi:hypothetical protein
LAEQLTLNQRVGGSIPSRRTNGSDQGKRQDHGFESLAQRSYSV